MNRGLVGQLHFVDVRRGWDVFTQRREGRLRFRVSCWCMVLKVFFLFSHTRDIIVISFSGGMRG